MRVVFMGTPEFAVAVLRQIVEAGWDVAAAYTQPDKPKNRGMKLVPTPVKEYALTQNIPVYQPQSCRDEAVLEELRALEPDVIVVAAYGKLLPQALLDIPKVAIINVHSSILPQYRGAAPINWAILNGDTETGVTIQYMAAELDAGDILLVKKTPIGPEEDAAELYARLAGLGGGAACGALSLRAAGGAPRHPSGLRSPVPVRLHAVPGYVPPGLVPACPGPGQSGPGADPLALRRHGGGGGPLEGLPGPCGAGDQQGPGDHPLRGKGRRGRGLRRRQKPGHHRAPGRRREADGGGGLSPGTPHYRVIRRRPREKGAFSCITFTMIPPIGLY